MAQIFISHSNKDEDLKNFFARVFAGTKVKAIFEEFEKMVSGSVNSSKIKNDIDNSNAVFVVLSPNVEGIQHTRDWVLWETGVAINKDIWVFEPFQYVGLVSVITPRLRHYVIFSPVEEHFGYVRQIIESYDDSHVLPALLVGGGVGALLADKQKIAGATVGGLFGLALTDKSKDRPAGNSTVCPKCSSSYQIHIPEGTSQFRCPVCNSFLEIKL